MKLKLPLEPGRYKSDHKDGQDITLVLKSQNDTSLYSDELCLWFNKDDGKAWGTPWRIIERLPSSPASIRAERDAMMLRLKELGAC